MGAFEKVAASMHEGEFEYVSGITVDDDRILIGIGSLFADVRRNDKNYMMLVDDALSMIRRALIGLRYTDVAKAAGHETGHETGHEIPKTSRNRRESDAPTG